MIWLLETPAPVDEAGLQTALPLLEPARRERLHRFRQAHSRIESILAGLLLRYGFEREYGRPLPGIAVAERGKPAFADPAAPCFNLSHCRAAVACALSREAVGVDVQQITAYAPKYRRILTDAEREWIEAGDSDRRFTALWTRKEAYGKALGCGIAYDMRKTAFAGAFSDPVQFGGWQLQTVGREGFFLSVCGKEPLQLQSVSLEALLEPFL